MFENLSNFLTPQFIVNFLKNNVDAQKIGLNFLNSEEGKNFIVNTLGYNYEDFKSNLTNLFLNTKKSENGIKKQQEAEEGQKIKIYRELANTLIKEDGLPIYGAVIMSAGFTGIEKTKVVEFLRQKGYSASEERIEKYYNKNEEFLKGIMKKHGKIIPGWNSSIESSDLELEESKKEEKLSPIPETSLEEDLGKETK